MDREATFMHSLLTSNFDQLATESQWAFEV